ncbi:MAG TPA: hypothetical protein HPP81_04790 [Deltaproteobacteria bacterium]|jgi:hypothetical protein|nr:hypothetical protein [Deltaproteobacteria bacterium]
MKKKNGKNGGEVKGNAGEEKLSRRTAIKRIATIFAGAAGAAALGQQTSDEMHLAQQRPYNPYSDAVYVPPHPPYVRYSSFYTSYGSHKIYVPPPYSSRK